MKYLLFVFTLLLGSQSQALPIVSLAPSGSSLGFNQAFTVDVFVSGIEVTDSLLAFGFDVGLDPGLTYNLAAVAAPFLDDSAFFPGTEVAGSTLTPASGSIILLSTLSLTTGTTAGLLDISIFTSPSTFGLSEGLFTLGGVFDISSIATVEVIRGSTVPLPPTILLLCLGLLGLIFRQHTR